MLGGWIARGCWRSHDPTRGTADVASKVFGCTAKTAGFPLVS